MSLSENNKKSVKMPRNDGQSVMGAAFLLLCRLYDKETLDGAKNELLRNPQTVGHLVIDSDKNKIFADLMTIFRALNGLKTEAEFTEWKEVVRPNVEYIREKCN